MKSPTRNYRISVDLVLVLILVVAIFAPIYVPIRFLFPMAVAGLLEARVWWLRVIPILSFAAGLMFPLFLGSTGTGLDLLSWILLFCFGLMIRKPPGPIQAMIWGPLVISLVAATVLCVRQMHTFQWTYAEWANHEIFSGIFPNDSRLSQGFYTDVLLPIYKASLPCWYAVMMAIAFFVNGTFHSLFAISQVFKVSRRKASLWDQFYQWKAPDWVLAVLVVGLLGAVLPRWIPSVDLPWLERGAWFCLVLVLYPIFLQGINFASFIIRRIPLGLVIFFFIVVFFSPGTILVLAGLLDLWFDLRSRLKPPQQ